MKRPLMASLVVALVIASLRLAAQPAVPAPRFEVDPHWPKPFPLIKDKDGKLHRWATGEIGGTCIDSAPPHLHAQPRLAAEPAWQTPHLRAAVQRAGAAGGGHDPAGNVVASWGDASLLAPGGGTKVMPESLHGCFADNDDNIWIAGNADGIVQKYSHDGKLLLQIGTKGVCDGKAAPAAPGSAAPFFPTCVSPGLNGSKTMLNDPADIAVDPNPDPVTGTRGSVYIADGYGNHRIVVFDGNGQFLRQWGSPGKGPGQFALEGGGHPHCVTIGKDGLVYVSIAATRASRCSTARGSTCARFPSPPKACHTRGDAPTTLPSPTIRTRPTSTHRTWAAGRCGFLNRVTGAIVGGIGGMGQGAGVHRRPHDGHRFPGEPLRLRGWGRAEDAEIRQEVGADRHRHRAGRPRNVSAAPGAVKSSARSPALPGHPISAAHLQEVEIVGQRTAAPWRADGALDLDVELKVERWTVAANDDPARPVERSSRCLVDVHARGLAERAVGAERPPGSRACGSDRRRRPAERRGRRRTTGRRAAPGPTATTRLPRTPSCDRDSRCRRRATASSPSDADGAARARPTSPARRSRRPSRRRR